MRCARCTSFGFTRLLSDPTGREVCGYLLVRGSVHAHAYALALKKITAVSIEQMLPTPNIPLGNIPRMSEVSRRRLAPAALYLQPVRLCRDGRSIWTDELALPGDPPGELEVVEGAPDGGKKSTKLTGVPSAFTPDYAPEEMFEIAEKLYKSFALSSLLKGRQASPPARNGRRASGICGRPQILCITSQGSA